MDFVEYIASKFNGIDYALLSTFLFCILPLSVIVIGDLLITKRKKKNQSTTLIKVITVIAEIIALIPLIGIIFFAEDNVLYLFLLPINIIGAAIFLTPIILPILFAVTIKKRKKQNEPLTLLTVCFSIAELLFLIFNIWFIFIK